MHLLPVTLPLEPTSYGLLFLLLLLVDIDHGVLELSFMIHSLGFGRLHLGVFWSFVLVLSQKSLQGQLVREDSKAGRDGAEAWHLGDSVLRDVDNLRFRVRPANLPSGGLDVLI